MTSRHPSKHNRESEKRRRWIIDILDDFLIDLPIIVWIITDLTMQTPFDFIEIAVGLASCVKIVIHIFRYYKDYDPSDAQL